MKKIVEQMTKTERQPLRDPIVGDKVRLADPSSPVLYVYGRTPRRVFFMSLATAEAERPHKRADVVELGVWRSMARNGEVVELSPLTAVKHLDGVPMPTAEQLMHMQTTCASVGVPQVRCDINFVPYGYQMDIWINGRVASLRCRDFGSSHRVSDLISGWAEKLDKSVDEFRKGK